LTNELKISIIKIGNGETTKVVAKNIKITVYSWAKSRTVIFYCLCSKNKMAIAKATFMIDIPTSP